MPKLPVPKLATTRLSTQPASRQLSPSNAAAAGVGLQAFGGAVSDAGDTWQEAVDYSQTITKSNNTNQELNDIYNRSLEEPDYNSYDKYSKELDDVSNKLGEGFSSNRASQRFVGSYSPKVESTRNKINGLFRAKTIDHTMSEIDRSEVMHKDAYVTAGSDIERAKAKKDYLTDISNGRNKMYLSEQQETNYLQAADLWDVDRAVYDATIYDANEVAKDLKAGKNYKIPSGAKKDVIKKVNAVNKIKDSQMKKEIRMEQITNELSLLDRFRKTGIKDMSVESVITMAENKEVRPKFAEALGRYIFNPEVYNEAAVEDLNFDGHINDVLNSTNKSGINEILFNVLNKPTVASTDLDILIGLSIAKSDTLVGIEEDAGDVPDAAANPFVEGFRAVFDWAKETVNIAVTPVLRMYNQKVKDGETPDNALIQTQNETILKKYPQMKNFPKEGKKIPDKYGNVRIYFPDGSYKEVE